MSELLQGFLDRIERRDATVGVIGIGYVGLPVAVAFAEAGFSVVGVDLNEDKVNAINTGKSHLVDVPDTRVARLVDAGSLVASASFASLAQADAIIVTVPTPLADGQPDLSSVVLAGEELAKVLKVGSLVILESTTYPGTTEELLKPLLEAGGSKAGEDFMLAYSPERIDPGNPDFSFADIPKVVGGLDFQSTEAAVALYRQVVPNVVVVSGTKEAELSKLIENTYRHVNIALVNELTMYSNDLGIDIWEAIGAAATKPFGFMPFWPSPGWGGHCIPLDPSYLSWRVRQERSHEVRFVELAQAINSEMPRYVLERIGSLLNEAGKPIKGSRILGVGVAYKGGTEDTRESPGIRILNSLIDKGAEVSFHDPMVPAVQLNNGRLGSVPHLREALIDSDLVVIFVKQDGIDWDALGAQAPLVFDCCNALGRTDERIHRL